MPIIDQNLEPLDIEQIEFNRRVNKLVRDEIPNKINDDKEVGDPVVSRLKESEFKIQLLSKLIEEGRELLVEISPISNKVKEEFSDVLEVMRTINSVFNFDCDLTPSAFKLNDNKKHIPIASSITIFVSKPTRESFLLLVDSISREYRVLELDPFEIEDIRVEKKSRVGGFEGRKFLIGITKK